MPWHLPAECWTRRGRGRVRENREPVGGVLQISVSTAGTAEKQDQNKLGEWEHQDPLNLIPAQGAPPLSSSVPLAPPGNRLLLRSIPSPKPARVCEHPHVCQYTSVCKRLVSALRQARTLSPKRALPSFRATVTYLGPSLSASRPVSCLSKAEGCVSNSGSTRALALGDRSVTHSCPVS